MNNETQPKRPTITLSPCKSSQICGHGYDPATKTMALQFFRGPKDARLPGTVYHYANVAPAQYEELTKAESIGKHFGLHFKGNADHPHTKLEAETKEDGDGVA